MASQPSTQSTEELSDLGFGSKVMQQSPLRLLNRDGTFNVSRDGLPFWQSINLYQILLEVSWGAFVLILFGVFLAANVLFALMYLLSGPDALLGTSGTTAIERFLESFFFSVYTITTVGFGHIAPRSLAANVVATLEAFLGLSAFALAAGLIFARFARPTAKILFSKQALVGLHRKGLGFKLRMANGGRNELLRVEVRILLCMTETVGKVRTRRFHQLSLERRRAAFFPLDWTVVHPISADSPLHHVTEDQLRERDAEFLVLVNAVDDASAQPVHARSSYKWNEVVWYSHFTDMYRQARHGHLRVDLRRIHDIAQTRSQDPQQTVWDF